MKKNKIISLIIILIIISLIFAYFNTRQKNTAQILKIGIIAPLTGDAAMYGQSLKNGINIANILYAEKYPDPKVDMIFEDSEAIPQKAINAINKLISSDNVDWIIGDMFTSTTLAIAPIAQKNNILLLSPTGSSNEISKSGSNIYRIYPSEIEEANSLVNFARVNFGQEENAIVCTNEDAMNNMSNIIYDKSKNNTTFKETFNKSLADFKTIITNIPNTCKIVYFIGYLNDASKFILQSNELNKRYRIISISTLYDPKFIELISGNTLDIFISAPYFTLDSEDMLIRNFVSKYNEIYHKDPDVWAGYGFDSFNITMYAWAESQKKSTTMTEAMNTVRNYEGVTGKTTINSDHSIDKLFKIAKVTKSGFDIIN